MKLLIKLVFVVFFLVFQAGANTPLIDFTVEPGNIATAGKADLGLWRPGNGTWYTRNAEINQVTVEPILRPGGFTVYQATVFLKQWGLSGDIPLRAHSDEDNLNELLIWRPDSGHWFNCTSMSGYNCSRAEVEQFGTVGSYPIAADFDGDGRSDKAYWQASYGSWVIRTTTDARIRVFQWGLAEDLPLAADVDGDQKDDLAVWRPSTGTWYLLLSSENYDASKALIRQWGLPGDHPILGHYDSDAKADLAVWRPSSGTWYICGSENNFDCTRGRAVQWGLPGDIPIPADFDEDGLANFAVWRPSEGNWYIRDFRYSDSRSEPVFVRQWGLPGDIPLGYGIKDRVRLLYGDFRPRLLRSVLGDSNGDGLANREDLNNLFSFLFEGGVTPENLLAADINQDGYIDLSDVGFVEPQPIVAGDADGDGEITQNDARLILSYLFLGGPAPLDLQVADANQDERLDISDAVYIFKLLDVEIIRGDANADGQVTQADVEIILAYLFEGGSAPESLLSADANQDSRLDISDAIFISNHLFIRGDANDDGFVDLADVEFILAYLFEGGAQPRFLEAADTNADGAVDISDAIYLSNYLSLGGNPPPSPFPSGGLGSSGFPS